MVVLKFPRKLGKRQVPLTQQIVSDFILPASGQVSATIHHKVSGDLVRTLFSNESFQGGTTQVRWDTRRDNGELIANPLDYEVRATMNPHVGGMVANWVSVIGNTSKLTGKQVNTQAHPASHMVWFDGKWQYVCGYAEGTQECVMEFDPAAPSDRLVIGSHREFSGYYTAADANLCYRQGRQGHLACMVIATNRSRLAHQFPYGQDINIGHNMYYGIDLDNDGDSGTGLAVQQQGRLLFSAHMYSNEIRIFDKVTGLLLRTWYCDSPREITLLDDTTMVLLCGDEIRQYKLGEDGIGTRQAVVYAGVPTPVALGYNGVNLAVVNGNRLNDPRNCSNHVVVLFNGLTGEKTGEFGQRVGYDVSPRYAPDKFQFLNNKEPLISNYGVAKPFIAGTPGGGWYVGDTGNLCMKEFDASLHYLTTVMWTGFGYSCSADPKRPKRVFSGFHEFEVLKDPATGAITWRLVANWSGKFDPGYDDMQTRALNVMTYSNGRTYCLLQKQSRADANFPRQFVELDPETGYRYTGVFTKDFASAVNSDETLWRCTHGLLGQRQKWWKSAITFDANHNPVIGPEQLMADIDPITYFDPITEGGGLSRNQVLEDGSICVFNSDLPGLDGVGRGGAGVAHVGFTDPAGTRLSEKVAYSTHRRFRGGYNRQGLYEIGNRIQNNGTIGQVFGGKFFCIGCKGEFFKNAQTNMYGVWLRGHLVLPFGVWNDSGSPLAPGFPGLASNANRGDWVEESPGLFVYYHCDEGFHSGIHRWEVTGTESLVQLKANLRYVAQQAVTELELLKDVPYNTSFTQGMGGWTRLHDYDAISVNGLNDVWPWRAASSIYEADRWNPDAMVEVHSQDNNGGKEYLRYTLPLLADNLTAYRLRGNLGWISQFDNATDFGGLRVYNDQMQVIFETNRREVRYPDDYRLQATAGMTVVKYPVEEWSMLMRYLQPFTLDFTSEGVLYQYGPFAAVLVPYPAGVSWGKPHIIELVADVKGSREAGVAANKLKFSTTPSTLFA